MLRLALADAPADEVSLVDLERNGPSYTADTLEALTQHFDRAKLFFLMGEDSLRDFPSWHDPNRILNLADLAVAGRPGVDADLETVARDLPALDGRIHLVSAAELAISSSDIRRRVRANESIRGLVPPAVADYIERRHLYSEAEPPLLVAT